VVVLADSSVNSHQAYSTLAVKVSNPISNNLLGQTNRIKVESVESLEAFLATTILNRIKTLVTPILVNKDLITVLLLLQSTSQIYLHLLGDMANNIKRLEPLHMTNLTRMVKILLHSNTARDKINLNLKPMVSPNLMANHRRNHLLHMVVNSLLSASSKGNMDKINLSILNNNLNYHIPMNLTKANINLSSMEVVNNPMEHHHNNMVANNMDNHPSSLHTNRSTSNILVGRVDIQETLKVVRDGNLMISM
jgi:hypothetical protein